MSKIIALFVLLPLVGCAAVGDEGTEPASDLEEILRSPRTFDLDLPDSEITAIAAALREGTESAVDFEIVNGEIELMAQGGWLGVTGIDVELADVTIPDTVLPPNGLVLTDMHVDLAASSSAEAEWTVDGRRVDATVPIDLAVQWSMLRDGESFPLADVRVEALPIHIGVTRDGDQLVLTLGADRDGRFWSWADTYELRDLEVDLAGAL